MLINPYNINKYIKISFLVLISSIFIFGRFHCIDIAIQDLLYNFDKKAWIFDAYQPLWRFLFYDLVRFSFHIFIFAFLAICIVFRNKAFIKNNERNILIFFLSSTLSLLIVNLTKEVTNMPCPLNIDRYKEGGVPITAIWESYKNYIPTKKMTCWPGGHASIGFSFISAFFLFNRPTYKYIALAFGACLGWILGFYKMTFGDHFFSHNFITMLICWIIPLIITKYIDKMYKFTKITMIATFILLIGHIYTMFCSYTKPYRCSIRRIIFIQDSIQKARERL